MKAEMDDHIRHSADEQGTTIVQQQHLPQSGNDPHPTTCAHMGLAEEVPFTIDMQALGPTHFRFYTPQPPTLPIRICIGLTAMNIIANTVTQTNKYSILSEQGGILV
jgi:hypothetical protein